jgi:hypothetical protein
MFFKILGRGKLYEVKVNLYKGIKNDQKWPKTIWVKLKLFFLNLYIAKI